MKSGLKLIFGAQLLAAAVALAACSGLPASSTSTGGSGSGSGFTIGGTVTGLTGTGLVLQDNGKDNLTITASGPFVFPTGVSNGGPYAVTVATQPTNPPQSCSVAGGSGNATANVTNVAITCTTAAANAKIGVTVSGLTGSGLVLQDNGGDSITVTANGSYTFKTTVTGAYSVTVLSQPTAPTQLCTVTKGSGIATGDVTGIPVSCVNSFTVGGNINGLVGTGLVLQNNKTDNLAPTGNGAFTFKTQIATGKPYSVTVLTQPSAPAQTCVVATGTDSGSATANVTSVVVNCKAVTFSVGGNVVGLAGRTPTPPSQINLPLNDNSFEIQNNLGNTLIVPQNGPFLFATPEALNDQYEISVFHGPSSQTDPCTLWGYKGVVTGNVSDIVIDCGHDDWTWIDGEKIAGVAGTGGAGAPLYGQFPATAPTTIPNPLTNTPGGRYGAAGWTDKFGNLFLFGGTGFELTGNPNPDTLNAPMQDMWVCVALQNGCEWQLVGGYDPAAAPAPFNTVGAVIQANAQHEGQPGGSIPASRLGAATWTDAAGNLWLFGGATGGTTGNNFLNDLWEYDTSAFTGNNYTTTEGTWIQKSVAGVDQAGVYTGGTPNPGSRTNAVTWTDASGNFWLFGGRGYDSLGHIGHLNDLWKFSGGTWTFVSGGSTNLVDQKGIYGSQGVAASTNMPGGRQEAAGWADLNGNLWLFGGEGVDSVGTDLLNGILNDLWMYNIATNQWTWVGGANVENQTAVYPSQPVVGSVAATTAAGTCGLAVGDAPLSCSPISLTGAYPSSRWAPSSWVDDSGNLWLFGGWGLDSVGTDGNGGLNDLWVYTPNATPGQLGTWAWIKGSNTGAQIGSYDDKLYPWKTHITDNPGGRSKATSWVDHRHQFWLFGGLGYDSATTNNNGYLNDMWRYVPYE